MVTAPTPASGEAAAPGIDTAIPFMLFSLLIGVLVRTMSRVLPRSWYRPPYAVAALLLSVATAAAQRSWGLGLLGRSVEYWSGSHPHVILFAFLPPLVYEDALSLPFAQFRRIVSPALVLALLGTCLSVALLVPLTHLIIAAVSPAWTWGRTFMLCVILSATDPVAVVAVLKDLRAPSRFVTLISGQALIADGTIFVLFFIAKEVLGESNTLLADLGIGTKVMLGGVACGLAVSALVYAWLRFVYNDPATQHTLVLVGAFAAFYVGEGIFHVSGVIATLVLGLFMSYRGKYMLGPHIEHESHVIVGEVAFVCNTIIFSLAGVVTFDQMARATSLTFGGEMRRAMLIFLNANAVRFVVMLALLPLLRRLGYGMSLREALLLAFSGMRGAVAIALSLMVNDEQAIDSETRAMWGFQVAAMVIMSLLINGSSLGLVYAKLRPHPTPVCRSALLTVALGMLDQHVADFARVLGSDWFFKNADWEGVATLVPESRQDEGGPAGSPPMSDGITWVDVFARLVSTRHEAPPSLQANGFPSAEAQKEVMRAASALVRTRLGSRGARKLWQRGAFSKLRGRKAAVHSASTLEEQPSFSGAPSATGFQARSPPDGEGAESLGDPRLVEGNHLDRLRADGSGRGTTPGNRDADGGAEETGASPRGFVVGHPAISSYHGVGVLAGTARLRPQEHQADHRPPVNLPTSSSKTASQASLAVPAHGRSSAALRSPTAANEPAPTVGAADRAHHATTRGASRASIYGQLDTRQVGHSIAPDAPGTTAGQARSHLGAWQAGERVGSSASVVGGTDGSSASPSGSFAGAGSAVGVRLHFTTALNALSAIFRDMYEHEEIGSEATARLLGSVENALERVALITDDPPGLRPGANIPLLQHAYDPISGSERHALGSEDAFERAAVIDPLASALRGVQAAAEPPPWLDRLRSSRRAWARSAVRTLIYDHVHASIESLRAFIVACETVRRNDEIGLVIGQRVRSLLGDASLQALHQLKSLRMRFPGTALCAYTTMAARLLLVHRKERAEELVHLGIIDAMAEWEIIPLRTHTRFAHPPDQAREDLLEVADEMLFRLNNFSPPASVAQGVAVAWREE